LLAVDRALRTEERAVLLLNKARMIASDLMFSHGLPNGDMAEDGYPQRWKPAVFEDLATLHRGFDLPVAERKPGPVPVIGSNGVVGMHDEAKCSGPGVMTGRSGSIGLSFYAEGPHWPLNTSLYVSDFHGNEPLFVHFFIKHFDLERFAAGVSVPTLNRNLVHKAAIRFPDNPEQRRIAEDLQALELAEANASERSSLLRELFLTLLDRLMSGNLSMQDVRLDRSEVSNA